MAAKGWTKWQDHRVLFVFWLATLFCLVLAVLHFSPDGGYGAVIPWGWGQCPDSESLETETPYASSKPQKQRETVVKVAGKWESPSVKDDRPNEELEDLKNFEQPRRYMPLGSAAFLFVQFGAYRTGPNSFAIVGLGSKGLHKYGNPGFDCSWFSNGENSTVRGGTSKRLPDWGLGLQYSVVVVHCMFSAGVGVDGSGGRLEFVANHGHKDHTGLPDVHWVALTEEAKEFDGSIFEAPHKYDYLYCGSPIFGKISPQRIREWIAYHVSLFGPRGHFILYDAGGIHEGVRKILEPWVKRGSVTVMNIRQESRYDQYYFSQFLVNNDCLFRGKTLANWTFYFDVDEFMFVPEPLTFEQVMLDYFNMGRRAQQIHFKQHFMSHDHCRNESLSAEELERKWLFEKLVYRRTEQTKRWGFPNRKYAIQAQYASSSGVHNTQDTSHPPGMGHKDTVVLEDVKLTYNHYHHTIDRHDEICENFVDPTLKTMKLKGPIGFDGPPGPPDFAWHVLDITMAAMADKVKEFESQTIGQQPFFL